MTFSHHMLVFDFDGVMVNSVDEVTVVAYNAATGEILRHPSQLPPTFVDRFRRNIHRLQPAADVPVLARWCTEAVPGEDLTSERFAELRRAVPLDLRHHPERFYEARLKLFNASSSDWFALFRPFEPLWSALCRHPESLLIVSNRNRRSIADCAVHFGLPLSPENIYSGDGGTTKTENFRKLIARLGTSEISFLDDSVHNLLEISAAFPSIECLWASWGNVGPEDRAIATAAGFVVSIQADIVERLRKFTE